ncbi:MAG: ribonuclease E/G, partial [Rikenellaceae bacterium]|nr:ribonuclease E/G [Rikenellaceae bacterium]
MNKELIINVTPNEIHIALLEDKVLVEYSKERCQTGFSVGDIYLGKVKKIMPGLNAAFVNIGHEKDAFIHYLDLGPQFLSLQKSLAAPARKQAQPANAGKNQQHISQKGAPAGENGKQPVATEAAAVGADNPSAGNGQRGRGQKGRPQSQGQPQSAPAEQAPVTTLKKDGKISQVLTQGQSIMVQIAKEAISTKGPRLTADISLAGRHVVLLPLMNKISISQKIRSNEEKKRLKKMAESVLPKNYGVIIRTAAVGKETEDLKQEIIALVRKWEGAFQKTKHETPPALLASEMNRTTAILRDLLNVSFSSIHVNDEALYEEIKEYIRTIEPEKEKIVKLYRGTTAIFDNFDVTKQIKSSFGRTISFKKGAYIIIEHTEALHVVDVNSGKRAKVADTQEETAL